MKIIPVILSGGSGTRLWPLSREERPKQFLSLIDNETLFSKTLKRVSNPDIFSTPIVIANENHRFFVAEYLRQNNIENFKIFLESEGKNTAPAVAIACLEAMQNNKEAIVLVLPSDHLIKNNELFSNRVKEASKLALKDKIVLFGVQPDYPETGYGYIDRTESGIVNKFIEKPSHEEAQKLIEKNCLWNSGIFLFKAKKYLSELQKYEPDIYKCALSSYNRKRAEYIFDFLCSDSLKECKNISIDYAVMERSSDIHSVILENEIGWSDIGNFKSLAENLDKNEQGNIILGEVLSKDCTNSLFYCDKGLLVGIGLENLAVIKENNATIVLHKDKAQDIKCIVDELKKTRMEHLFSTRTYRPWGWYEELESEKDFKVKRVLVNPYSEISLQYHNHRAEHWVIVRGTATITIDKKQKVINTNESTFIPFNKIHKIANNTNEDLEFIEVQTGEYISEDDIVRLQDKYGRT